MPWPHKGWELKCFFEISLKVVPGYRIIKRTLTGFTERRKSYPAVMVELFQPGTAVFGFVMEENENDLLTVFVPSVPMVTTGNLHIVKRDRVTFIDAKAIEVADCISRWGSGTPRILGGLKL